MWQNKVDALLRDHLSGVGTNIFVFLDAPCTGTSHYQ